MDDTLKQQILGLALAEVKGYRPARHPLREIGHELQPAPIGAPTLHRCECGDIPLRAVWEEPAMAWPRPDPVRLDMGTWADGPGPLYHVWLGQCQECRTIWWRIQEA